MSARQSAEKDAPATCPGDGLLRHADCYGCSCSCHWRPPATVAAGDFDDLGHAMAAGALDPDAVADLRRITPPEASES